MPNRNIQSPPQKAQPVPPRMPPSLPQTDGNEGEGSRTAARNYDDEAARYAKSGRVEPAAKAAKAALEGTEGAELRQAEAEARADDRKTNPDASASRKAQNEETEPEEADDEGSGSDGDG